MSRREFLRISSAQNLCIYCACRLKGQLPTTYVRSPLASSHRGITTTRSAAQSAESSATDSQRATYHSPASRSQGFDPETTLTSDQRLESDFLAQQATSPRQRNRNHKQDVLLKNHPKREVRIRRFGSKTELSTDRQQEAQSTSNAYRRSFPARDGLSGEGARPESDAGKGGHNVSVHSRRPSQKPVNRLSVTNANPTNDQNTARSNQQSNKNKARRVALPGFLTQGEDARESATAAFGWGMGDTERTSVEYGNREQEEPVMEPRGIDVPIGASASNERDAVNRRGIGPATNEQPTFAPRRHTTFSPFTHHSQEPDSHKISGQSYPDTGYRTTPFDPSELTVSHQKSDNSSPETWTHLRRRNQPVASETINRLLSQQPEDTKSNESRIDDIFEKYRRERDSVRKQLNAQQQRPAPSSNVPGVLSPFTQSSNTNKRCSRCGQMGHVARSCPDDERNRCFRCGGPGHRSSNCPQKDTSARPQSQTQGSRSDYVQDKSIFHGARHLRSSPPPSEETPTDTPGEANVEPDVEESPLERAMRSSRFAVADDSHRKEKGSRRGRRDDWDNVENDDRSQRRERDDFDDDPRLAVIRAERRAVKQAKKEQEKRERAAARRREQAKPINLPEYITVANLAQALGVQYEYFVGRLKRLGYDDVFAGKVLNAESSGMIAMEYGFEPNLEAAAREDEERDLKAQPEPETEDKEVLPARPPVVTIMGHVDHGKTTILDFLRKSSVAAGEAGGITQHIGAFSVPLASSGRTITFLDTPGHAAFLAMRQRGANVTDIVVLVVAADDSVKPQTLEAVKHARGAGVPIIVAVNKVDKPEADVERVKQDLARHDIDIEDYGGETQVIPVSGKTGQGMEDLEEAIVTQSEILDHRADTSGMVEGWVLEATTKQKGRVATVLIRRGTLKPGDIIVAGKTWARVRTLRNEGGQNVHEATPGTPVEVDGWRDQPLAGDEVLQADSEQRAGSVVGYRIELSERQRTAEDIEAINENRRAIKEKRDREESSSADDLDSSLSSDVGQGSTGQIVIPFIIKADVSGSAEAVAAYIMSVSSPLVTPRVLHSAVGQINESDVELASAAQGHIISFNLPTEEGMKAAAAAQGVQVLENNIIYRVLDDVKQVMEDKLPPIIQQKVLGEAEISATFEIGVGGRKTMKIAGCKIRNGVIGKNNRARVLRGSEKVYDGKISSLKNVKKDVQEMRKGSECGMGFENWDGFQVSDQIQTYLEFNEKRKL